MAQHEPPVGVAAGQRPGVAVDAENGGRRFGAGLADDHLPGRFALGALHLDIPQPRNARHVRCVGVGRREPFRPKRIWRAARAPQVLTFQDAVGQLRFEPGLVLVEAEDDGAMLDGAARGRDPLVAVEERAFQRLPVP